MDPFFRDSDATLLNWEEKNLNMGNHTVELKAGFFAGSGVELNCVHPSIPSQSRFMLPSLKIRKTEKIIFCKCSHWRALEKDSSVCCLLDWIWFFYECERVECPPYTRKHWNARNKAKHETKYSYFIVYQVVDSNTTLIQTKAVQFFKLKVINYLPR